MSPTRIDSFKKLNDPELTFISVPIDKAPPGCVLWLPGIPGSGNQIIDRSGKGNHGAITGATRVRLPSGLPVLSYDGNDLITLGNADSLKFANTTTLTLEAWIYPTVNEAGDIIGRSAPYAYLFMVVASVATVALRGQVWNTINTGYLPADKDLLLNTWQHVAQVMDVPNLTTYVNGAQAATIATLAGTFVQQGAPGTWISSRGAAPAGDYFTGRIALPRMYTSALTVAQLLNHYQQERHLFGV